MTITTHHNGYLLFILIAHVTPARLCAISYTRLSAGGHQRGCQTQERPVQGTGHETRPNPTVIPPRDISVSIISALMNAGMLVL